jgi:hypothetical protein
VNNTRHNLTLDQPVRYQITVPGHLDAHWAAWGAEMTMTLGSAANGSPITTLTGTFADQAALHGMLRRLYALGVPLISVNRVDADSE